MKYIKRFYGCLILPLFPVVLTLDLIFGFIVTGSRTTFNRSCRDVWLAWVETFWVCKEIDNEV